MSYDDFIVKAAMTFDTYGLGLIFQEILNTIRGYYEMRENVCQYVHGNSLEFF